LSRSLRSIQVLLGLDGLAGIPRSPPVPKPG
jgi:hypothetical protein